MKKAIVDLKQIKDKLKILMEAFPEEKELQIVLSNKSFLGIKSLLLVQAFFTAEVEEPFEIKLNVDEFKKVCGMLRSKSQMATIYIEDNSLVIENGKRKEYVPLSSVEDYKEKDLICSELGKINPVDLKCLLKINRPSTALPINDGLNEDLFVINKSGVLTIGVYSYSHSLTQFVQLDDCNDHKDTQFFVAYKYFPTISKIFKEQFMPIQLGVFNKFLVLDTGGLRVYLPTETMGIELSLNNKQSGDKQFVDADVVQKIIKEGLKDPQKAKDLVKDKTELSALSNLFNESIAKREAVMRRVNGFLSGSESVAITQSAAGLYLFYFKREFGPLYLYC